MSLDPEKVGVSLAGRLRPCPICDANDWSVSPDGVACVRFDFVSRQVTLGGSVVPMVLVTCKACGHIVLFNAVVLGLVS